MQGREYAQPPLAINYLSTRLIPSHNQTILHVRNNAQINKQLHYEPQSAKNFLYKAQMLLHNNVHPLPEIRSRSRTSSYGNKEQLDLHVKKIDKNTDDILPDIGSCMEILQKGVGRTESFCSVSRAGAVEEAKDIHQAFAYETNHQMSKHLAPSNSPVDELNEEPRDSGKDENNNNTSEQRDSPENSSQQFGQQPHTSGSKHRKKKLKKKKSKSRKVDGRKAKIYYHRLKSAKKNNIEDLKSSGSSHISQPPGYHYAADSVDNGILAAQCKAIKAVHREPRQKTTNERLYHSASKSPRINKSVGLPERAKTHVVLSPARPMITRNLRSGIVRSPLPIAVTAFTAAGSSSASTEQLKHVQELSLSTNRSHAYNVSQEIHKLTKIYLSEKQSGVLHELGVDLPCAPPATPAPEMYEKYEYVPSMGDIRAQRAVKMKLEILDRNERKAREKILADKLKREKLEEKHRGKQMKIRQRKEIYALNKVMTELEHENFKKFCKLKGIDAEI